MVRKISESLKSNDLANIPVTLYREEMCHLSATDVISNISLNVKYKLPSSERGKVDKFLEECLPLTDEVEDLRIDVVADLSIGEDYKTIKSLARLDKPGQMVDLVYKKGQVWLIDLWTTWCPQSHIQMEMNVEMLQYHEKELKNKVRIIGISMDTEVSKAAKFIKKKDKWKSFE